MIALILFIASIIALNFSKEMGDFLGMKRYIKSSDSLNFQFIVAKMEIGIKSLSNLDWWPYQLNLKVLHQNSSLIRLY